MKTKKKKPFKKSNKKAIRCFVFGLICFSIICMSGMWISKIWVNIYSKHKEKKDIEQKLLKLQEKEEKLKIDVKKMQDPEYIARYLREKYFYSKEGEYIIRIPE